MVLVALIANVAAQNTVFIDAEAPPIAEEQSETIADTTVAVQVKAAPTIPPTANAPVNVPTQDRKEPNWVVMGGVSDPQSLMDRFGPHKDVPGLVGLSTRWEPGRTVNELLADGKFPNKRYTYATEDELRAAAKSVGYVMKIEKTPGSGRYHATISFIDESTGQQINYLPQVLAEVLSEALKKRGTPENPYRFH